MIISINYFSKLLDQKASKTPQQALKLSSTTGVTTNDTITAIATLAIITTTP